MSDLRLTLHLWGILVLMRQRRIPSQGKLHFTLAQSVAKIGRATDRHDARPRAEAPGDYQDPQNVQLNTFHEEHHASFSLMHTRRSPKSREEGTQCKEEVWCYPSTPALGVNPIRGFTPRALRRVAAEHAHALPRIGGWHPGVECSVALRLNDSEYRPQIRRLRESLRSETT